MDKRVILIHGFNVRDEGENSIDRLKPMLREAGYRVEDFDYGFLGLMMVRFRTKFIAKMLHQFSNPEDIIIGHSHGCAITAKAMENGAKFDKVVFIHPALDKNWKIPTIFSARRITVFYSEKDIATWSAMLLRWISPLRLFKKKHFWGAMGSVGPKSKDKRWVAINDHHSHSGIFKDLDKWKDTILNAIK